MYQCLFVTGCCSRGGISSKMFQQDEDLWRKPWGSFKNQGCRASSVQTFQVRFLCSWYCIHNRSIFIRNYKVLLKTYMLFRYALAATTIFVVIIAHPEPRPELTNLLSCGLQIQAFGPIRPTGWRANCLSIAGWLGTCWPQHSVALVFCLCKVWILPFVRFCSAPHTSDIQI